MKLMIKILCFAFIIGSIVGTENVQKNSNAEDTLLNDDKKQSKREAEEKRGNANSVTHPSATFTNLPQFYGGHFAQLGNFFASATAPQIYYVKGPQSNHAGVQYAPGNALKIAYAPAPHPQHSVAYATAPTNSKIAIASPALYQPYQLAYTHQPLSYSPSAIALPYNHQQQIIPIAQTNGYQLAAIPHQQVQISQPYSYVTSDANEAGKTAATSNAAHTNNAQHQQQTFTYPTYQHVAAPINIPTTQKFVAFQSYSPAQYKAVNSPAKPSTTASTHTPNEGATSFATFSQQLNQRYHTTPTTAPVKVLAQPQQYYVTVPPSPAGYNSQKIAFQPITAASSSPQAYESPHNVNGAIHYGTHLYHPTLAKNAYGQVAPSQKNFYWH